MMQFHETERLICWWPEGALGREEILAYYRALGACSFGHEANRFCDFSLVTGFAIDYGVLRDLAEFRKQQLADHTGIRLVMLSGTPLGLGMARMYQSIMQGWDMEITVTAELDEAARVVGVDAGLLIAPAPP